MKRDFLTLADRTEAEYRALFDRAHALKASRKRKEVVTTLAGRHLVAVFEKASTRTHLSFEAAMYQLGGTVTTITAGSSQIARGETIEDTARVISGYADCIMFRTFGDDRLNAFAKASRVPVINGLSEGGHPVQIITDLFTVEERLGSVKGKTLAFVGDCASNMGLSFVEATRFFGFDLRLGCPEGYRPAASALAAPGTRVHVTADASEAVKGADVVVTDVWTSMGQEAESAKRKKDLHDYQLNEALLAKAKPGAIVLHCLPAHRGEEITDGVVDGAQSAVWDEAENRMHVQKALLEQLILG
ncbi:ornithine carbamoyltransferase [Vitiosangium sp. GDMCC 1.1324]|uniref:ornithine carbamoyltransferase n=1 Tax=Vitiosangium sp. (strain GDMCC 1.1324) TaxID=2138576 RepID=UPI000D3AD2E9|nr:ornithine carbamoyltransferase [Vitiosangium sp. GDMCC 1.1324]PTL85549.1 ornithine carbamoyltransferase [Vitiosangium sp. GDMCC 1.1324]